MNGTRTMWPFAHLAIGYVLYSGYVRVRFRRAPDDLSTLFVVAGTQLPDAIDKPLALIGVLSSGRSLGHSLLFASILIAAVRYAFVRWGADNRPVFAFAVGYVSAPIGDGVPQFFQGTLAVDLLEVSFWVWPLPVPAGAIVEHLAVTPTAGRVIHHKEAWTANNLPMGEDLKVWLRLFEVGITLLAAGLWVYDGAPGWKYVREGASRIRR